MNHKIEITVMHMVELVVHRLIRIVSRQHAAKAKNMSPTDNLYCMGAQWAPYLNTELRKQGLCTAYTSDFQFEVLMQIKQYVHKHGHRWNLRMLHRIVRNVTQRLLCRTKGWITKEYSTKSAHSSRPFGKGMIICPCCSKFHSECASCEKMVWGPHGFVNEAQLQSTAEANDGSDTRREDNLIDPDLDEDGNGTSDESEDEADHSSRSPGRQQRQLRAQELLLTAMPTKQ
eukprot:SAG31_NODE_1569_length_7855_cov_13.073234_2_plen_230_part_00